jgi:hypothetical protein
MRFRTGRLIAAAVLTACAGAAAVAATAAADPPGNNGDVKIEITGFFGGNANHPKPGCTFQVQGFGFDAGQLMSYTVDGQGGSNVAGEDSLGPINVQADGQGNFGPTPPGGHVLSFGQYKLRLDTNAPGGHKFKVFRVECEAPPAVATPPANVTPAPRPGANVVQPAAQQVVTAQPRTAG